MGYQLYWVRLCGVAEAAGDTTGAAGVRPKAHSPFAPLIGTAVAVRSSISSGALPELHAGHLNGDVIWRNGHDGAVPLVSKVPEPSRSAGSCRSRIAFGVIGLGAVLVTGPVPRANPSLSHSRVTGVQV